MQDRSGIATPLSLSILLLIAAGHVCSQEIVKSEYPDQSCSGSPSATETHIMGICTQAFGQKWSSTAACNSSYATIFFYPESNCGEVVYPKYYPVNTCFLDSAALKYFKVQCESYNTYFPNKLKKILYADAQCKLPLGALSQTDSGLCESNSNSGAPAYKVVCNTGSAASVFQEYNGPTCSGVKVKDFDGPCRSIPSAYTPGYYLKYACSMPPPTLAPTPAPTPAPSAPTPPPTPPPPTPRPTISATQHMHRPGLVTLLLSAAAMLRISNTFW